MVRTAGRSEQYGMPAMVGDKYFDSITEAMWFDYFSAAGMDPVPQPGAFKLYSGEIYTPDFYLPKQDTYVEVKWGNFEYNTASKAQYLACETGSSVILIDGRPLDEDTVVRLFSADGDEVLFYGSDMSRTTADDYASYPLTFRVKDIIPRGFLKHAVIRVNTQIDPEIKRQAEESRNRARSDAQVSGMINWKERNARKHRHDDIKWKNHPGWYANLEEEY